MAPRLFTKLLAPDAAHLHLDMFMCLCIDDIFHAQDSEVLAIQTRDASICLHLQVGFANKITKSSLVPSQVMTHLGALIDTF